ncbi:hypothetical protein V5799_020921 [Amblyomma americanum]|uniref:Ran gtpase-activating protein n=1 Tax=Amblyomma americanum TaxID=6943 RepID=A0AAQ4ESP3_AMBAM
MADTVSVTTENWKGQLNFDSTCKSSGPLDRCGLISELQSWNRVLYGLNYELTETRPGKLRLRYAPHDPVEKWQTNAASMHSEAAFLISWLVEHHSCIDDLGITSIESNAKDSAPLRLRRPPGKDIRCLDISLCKSDGPSLYLVKEDVDGLRGIERLHISDSDATLESSAVTLLRNNSSSLGFVQLSYTNLSRDVIDALQQLEKCESLTVVCCTREGDDTISESNTVASILRSSAALKTFTFAGDRDEEWNFSSISDALETCVTLTAFDLTAIAVGESSSPRELFAALLGHTRLRKLRVEIRAIDASCGETLEWALSSNTWLVDLHLAGYVDDYCLIHIAEGLSQNITLEKLDLSEAVLNVGGALLLCDALRTNKTLKKLMLPDYWDPEEEKKALAEKLKHGDFYRRVRLPILEECDLLALSTRLGCPTTCPDELTDIEFCSISEATLKLFFDALASSSCVQAFSVSIEENPQAKIALLCDMLVANRSIKSLNIALMRDSWLVIQQLLNAIQANENISKLKISVSGAKMGAASAVSEFIARNRTITTFMLWMGGLSRDDLVEEIARGMLTNRTIVEHGDGGAAWEGFSYPIFEALQRNRVALNRAADFVLGIRDSRCAEAFEIFSRTSRLIALVMETSGQNEREAVHAIASADKFLRDNSLDIKGALQCATLPLAQRNKIG